MSSPDDPGRAPDRLASWKEIAAWFAVSVRTVQRWEKEEGLPVHRHQHASQHSVFAYPHELEQWWAKHPTATPEHVPKRSAESPRAATKSMASWRAGWVLIPIVGMLTAVLFVRPLSVVSVPPHVVRLTAATGVETQPSLSPDGSQVAFASDGEKQDNFDIYVKVVGSATALRLTTDPAMDQFPAWSPDGRQIAFASDRGRSGIYLVSPMGGGERKLVEVTTTSRFSWSPDGRFLAVATSPKDDVDDPDSGAVLLLPVDAGSTSRRVLPAQHGILYWHPAFSPDGRRLAVTVCSAIYRPRSAACQLHILQLDADLMPKGGPQVMGRAEHAPASSLLMLAAAWTADGNSLVTAASVPAGSLAGPEPWLWRLAATERAAPERLELAGPYAAHPAVDRSGRRVAFTRRASHDDIWRWQAHSGASPFLTSALEDDNPQFSHDGKHIAFGSRRGGGDHGIWLANADGSGLTQITGGHSSYCGTPRWSPDDRWIAFDAMDADGLWDIWIVEAGGGPARRLTHKPGDNGIPSWSRDGEQVYFRSGISGRHEIWRVARDAGSPEQVTRNGGSVAFESADGTTLYYTKSDLGAEGLFSIPLPTGNENQVIDSQVLSRGFVVFADGIYYISTRDRHPLRFEFYLAGPWRQAVLHSYRSNEIRFHDLRAGMSRIVAEITGPLSLGLSVSPDRRTFLFTKHIAASDLMLIENFR